MLVSTLRRQSGYAPTPQPTAKAPLRGHGGGGGGFLKIWKFKPTANSQLTC